MRCISKVAAVVLTGMIGLILAGCSSKEPDNAPIKENGAPKPAAKVDHTSPMALARSLHAAVLARNYGALGDAMAPDARKDFKTVLEAIDRYAHKVDVANALVAEKIGPDEAATFARRAMAKVDLLPFKDRTAGQEIVWESVTAEPRGDKAVIYLNTPDNDQFVLRQVKGNWYLAGPTDSRTNRKMAAETRKLFDAYGKMIDQIAADVRTGKINKDNVDEKLLRPVLDAGPRK